MNGSVNDISKHNKSDLPVDPENFRSTIDGKETFLFVLENAKGMKVAITNYGGRIVSWLAPDKDGNFDDIVLGFNSIDKYVNASEQYHGALIGRYANRIAKGKFTLDGKTYQLTTNNIPNHLHGGPKGFHNVVWDAKQISNNRLVLKYISKDGEEGYPGKLKIQVHYELTDDNALSIDYTATSREKTILNVTNHAFFNLSGSAGGPVDNHILKINADYYTPIDSNFIPSGEIKEVDGTPFDFTEPTKIGSRLDNDNEQLRYARGYDHNFVLNRKENGKLGRAAKVYDPESGRVMEIYTTEPGLHFYGGNFLDGSDTGKEGKPYEFRTAFCLETQHFPDSPNHPNFPSTILAPDSVFHSLTTYQLSTN